MIKNLFRSPLVFVNRLSTELDNHWATGIYGAADFFKYEDIYMKKKNAIGLREFGIKD